MRRSLALVLVALLALVGCGDDDGGDEVGGDEPATEPGGFDDPLLDRTLTVTEATGHEIVAGTTITMSFDGTQVAVEAGCNHLSGSYTYDGDALVVDALAGTEMGCDPERMEQDAWISAFLADRPVVLVAADGATTLTTGDEVLTLAEEPAEALPLVGTTWGLTTLIAGGVGTDGTASSVNTGVVASVTFADDGTYQVVTGCNTGSGTYAEAGDGTYQLGAPTLTRRRCDDATAEVEAAMAATLAGEVSVSIEADSLTLQTAHGPGLGFAGS